MNLQRLFLPLLGAAAFVVAWHQYRWPGVAMVGGAIVMWMLLHFTRMMKVLERASSRPIGYCDSAVMLNAKLRVGVNLLHVLAMTRSLGELLSPKGEQPEIYRWTDGTASHVTCEFKHGKLVQWALERPEAPADLPASVQATPPADAPAQALAVQPAVASSGPAPAPGAP